MGGTKATHAFPRDVAMICPHCSRSIHFEETEEFTFRSEENSENGKSVVCGFCPACAKLIVLLRSGIYSERVPSGVPYLFHVVEEETIFPTTIDRPPLPPEVPADVRKDFEEAAAVLPISAKASAAISRRLLQHILRDKWNIRHKTLAAEISEFADTNGVPSHLSAAIDAVRHVGNFAAHPEKDNHTGSIIDVEPGEADWLLEVIEALCDFTYVQPERLQARKRQLNDKLEAMGKPPMK